MEVFSLLMSLLRNAISSDISFRCSRSNISGSLQYRARLKDSNEHPMLYTDGRKVFDLKNFIVSDSSIDNLNRSILLHLFIVHLLTVDNLSTLYKKKDRDASFI